MCECECRCAECAARMCCGGQSDAILTAETENGMGEKWTRERRSKSCVEMEGGRNYKEEKKKRKEKKRKERREREKGGK